MPKRIWNTYPFISVCSTETNAYSFLFRGFSLITEYYIIRHGYQKSLLMAHIQMPMEALTNSVFPIVRRKEMMIRCRIRNFPLCSLEIEKWLKKN